ncbi:MAG: hypothetical protein EOP88_18340 [Verrucomicrobiaceae bacterium]|nr:MAG: hypothetical protein EOP88_18340 [Verrucomicrobiaceae bacterium]
MTKLIRAFALIMAMAATACVDRSFPDAGAETDSAQEVVTRCFISRTKDNRAFATGDILWNLHEIRRDLSNETSGLVDRYLSTASRFKTAYAGLWGSIPRASDALLLLKSDPLTSCGSVPTGASLQVAQQTDEKIDYDVTYELQGNHSRFSRTIRIVLIRQRGEWVVDDVLFPANTFPMPANKQTFRGSLKWLTNELDEASEWAANNRESLKTQEQLLQQLRSGTN